MKRWAVCGGALALALVSPFAVAHHSLTMFDSSSKVTVTGTVRAFQWTNPHAYIHIVAEDEAGRDIEWRLEMGAPMYLYARGWRPTTLKAGQRIAVTINPLRDGGPGGVVLQVTSEDGKPTGRGV